ncbi:uncharacterized protein LOC122255540 [Penaeus japonicus]|uniref:uncharacterized protein LOC122255540 n=1 Tax=Penaeus japonicus TaxID=27405 RepID=UPI001C70F174|nr:uncharacterized protein LOC122255540 [Penaeus japonicus]
MERKEKWLWKTTSVEQSFNTYNVSYQLTFATREPLLHDHLRRALAHLSRKVPLLRMCYAQRNGEWWLKEMCQEIIDFEMIPDVTIDEAHQKCLTFRYDIETGPLWCAKLKTNSLSLEGVSDRSMADFPHLNTLFLGIYHGITDGYSNMKICGFLIQLLEDVISGKPINDEEQLCECVAGEKTQRMVDERFAAIKANCEYKEKMVEEYQASQSKCLLASLIPEGAGEKDPKTRLLTRTLDVDTSAIFFKRCREEGVTVNSAFTALCSVAMVDFLVEGGIHRETYSISSNHVVNARRYWEGDTSEYLGCHALPTNPVVVETPRNVGAKFWDYAREVHREFLKTLDSGKALHVEAMKQIMRSESPDCGALSEQSQFDFCMTNMGDVTPLVTEGGDHVQVIHVLRCTAIHPVPNFWGNYLHSFRGRFINVLAYSTENINDQVAEKYCGKIFKHFHEAINIKK